MPPGFNRNMGQDRGPRAGASLKDIKKDSTVFRLFRYIFRFYKVNFVVVTLCIVVSSLTSLASSLFTRSLIDDGFAHPDQPVEQCGFAYVRPSDYCY